VTISIYHKDEIRVVVNNQEEAKSVTVCYYNINTPGVSLEAWKLQPYLLEQKKGIKWYLKLLKRLHSAAIPNALVIYRSTPVLQNHSLGFRSLLARLVWINSSGIPHSELGHPSAEVSHKKRQRDVHWSLFRSALVWKEELVSFALDQQNSLQ
jgi:hypothetical protein